MDALRTKFRAVYKRLSLREKLLCLTFIVVILVLWADNWLGRLSNWNSQRQFVATELYSQQQFLDREEFFTEGLAIALERVDPSKTYEGPQLSGRVDSLIRQVGLSGQADINSVRTTELEIFNDHKVRVELDRISIAQFIRLSNLLREDTPYINIQRVQVRKNKRNPEQLDVRYEINSFDLKDQNL